MASTATLSIKILADASQAAGVMDKASTRAGKFGDGLKKAALPAAAVIGGLALMGKAAADDARGQAILANTLTKTTGASKAQIAATEDFISKTALATGVADDQLRPAMSTLARATGDTATAQSAMTQALDISAATGKDVETVSTAIAKGYAGQTGALKKLVPGIDDAALASGDMTKIMADLAKKTGGTAAAAADTAAGKMQRAALAMDEVKESAGAALLPVLGTLGSMLGGIARFAQNNATAMQILVIAIGAIAAAILVANAAMSAYRAITVAVRVATIMWAAAIRILNFAMYANPIGLVILAIIALVAILVIAYKKSDTFRAIVQAAWNGIKNAAVAAWNWIKQYVIMPYLAYIQALWNAIKAAAAGIATAWNGMKSALKAAWDWIHSNVIQPWINAFDRVVGAVQKVIDWLGRIKIPGAVAKLFGASKAAPAAAAVYTAAPAVRGGRLGARAAPTLTTTGATDAGPVLVNVYLDGTKISGVIDRVVTRRFEAEGARLAAGAWR